MLSRTASHSPLQRVSRASSYAACKQRAAWVLFSNSTRLTVCRGHASGRAASSGLQSAEPDAYDIVAASIGEEDTFVELSLKGKIGSDMPWRQLTVRPVFLRGVRQLQVTGGGCRPIDKGRS